MISIDDDLFDELLKYVEGALPVHKRVGGAEHRDILVERLKRSKAISPPQSEVILFSEAEEPTKEEFEKAEDFFQRLEE